MQMSAYILRKRIFAVMFVAAMLWYAGMNAVHGYPEWKAAIEDTLEERENVMNAETVSELVTNLDTSLVESMYLRMDFIEAYSYMQVLLDKREYNNFTHIRDEDGFLHYASFFREPDTRIQEYAKRVKRMQDYVEAYGTKVIFFVTPSKYIEGECKLRTGLPANDPDGIVDELLFYLNRFGVETIDGRLYFPNEELSYEETFFKTDHHWTIPAAYYATQIFVEEVKNRFGDDWDPEHYYMDRDNYESVTYQDVMLGTMGRKTGVNFCAPEDFEAYWPKFEQSYERESMTNDGVTEYLSGDTVKSIMDVKAVTRGSDIYSNLPYSLYLDGLRTYEKIVNPDCPEGPKIFAVRDSYFSPMMVFLMPMCSEMHAIWSLEEASNLDIESYMKENEFDYIIVEIYPYNINEKAFHFFEEEEPTAVDIIEGGFDMEE